MKYIAITVMLTCSALSHAVNRTGTDLSQFEHPRLLLSEGEEYKIRHNIAASPELAAVHGMILEHALQAVNRPLPEFKIKGTLPRMLSLSRQVLGDIYSMAYAIRVNSDSKYIAKADSLLNRVCSYPTWNPSHFLDTGEMCMAVAIGADWLSNYLPDSTIALARKSIVGKALHPALVYEQGFYRGGGNWNSVCNSGLLYGAIAAYEENPELADIIIDKCYETNPSAMAGYNPDGAFPEGVNYWNYGTDFQAMLNAALEHLGMPLPGDDANNRGFFMSPYYYLNMIGPTDKCFNYSDGAEKMESMPQPALFYFAGRERSTALLCNAFANIRRDMMIYDRLMPSIPVYAKDLDLDNITYPETLSYFGRGTTPVYSTRSSWTDPDAAFFAVKGGRPSSSHAHNDAATFVYDVYGVRWACDLGNEPYEPIENAGLTLWKMDQSSDRWKLTRYSSSHHNTVTINGMPHLVNGITAIVDTIDSAYIRGAIADYSQAFDPVIIGSAVRTITLDDRKRLTVSDKFSSIKCPADIEWHFITRTVPEIKNNKIILTQGKHRVEVSVVSSVRVTAFADACHKAYSVEAPLDGCYRVGFRTYGSVTNDNATFTVQFTPVR